MPKLVAFAFAMAVAGSAVAADHDVLLRPGERLILEPSRDTYNVACEDASLRVIANSCGCLQLNGRMSLFQYTTLSNGHQNAAILQEFADAAACERKIETLLDSFCVPR
jgi:hypothetical protein